MYAVAHNAVGSSTASTMAVVRTLGGVPQPPPSVQFFTPNSSSVTVYPRAWVARGCPITHMVLEYRQKEDEHWVQGENLRAILVLFSLHINQIKNPLCTNPSFLSLIIVLIYCVYVIHHIVIIIYLSTHMPFSI